MFEIGGERCPKIGELDLFAFRHKPRHAVVEMAPLVPSRRPSPAGLRRPAEIDEARQRQYVYMVRNLGARRQPATVLIFGAGLIFRALCWLLHRRERFRVCSTVCADESIPATE